MTTQIVRHVYRCNAQQAGTPSLTIAQLVQTCCYTVYVHEQTARQTCLGMCYMIVMFST